MAAGAYGAGALPGANPTAGLTWPGLVSAGWPYRLGLAGWLAGTIALAVAWWRLGTALRRTDRPVGLGWLLATGALWAAPLLLAPPLASRDVYAYACQGVLWLGGHDPYAVGVDAGGCPWLGAVPPLWRDTPTPYGPLALALSGGLVAITRALPATEYGHLVAAVSLFRVLALAGGALVAGYAPRLARACGIDPVSATWLGLVSPLVAVHLVSGAHNDALMVGLVVAALAMAARPASDALRGRGCDSAAGRKAGFVAARVAPGVASGLAAGAALGLAAAIKITAVVAVPFVILLTAGKIRASRDSTRRHTAGEISAGRGDLGWAGAEVLGAGVAVFAGLSVLTGLGLGWLGALSSTGRLVQWTSLPSGLGMAAGYLLRVLGRPEAFDTAVAVARLAGLLTLAVAGAALCVRAWRAQSASPGAARRIVVSSCGAAFAALAVLSPVFYPWYALGPVIILAASSADARVRRALAVAVVVLSFLVLPNGLGLAVLTKLPGALLDVVLACAGAGAVVTAKRRRVARHRAAGRTSMGRTNRPGPDRLTRPGP